MQTGFIVAIVISCVALFLIFLWLFLSYWTFKRAFQKSDIGVDVDLREYSGKWYEVAAYDSWFEKQCGDSKRTALYEFKRDDTLRITNTCDTHTISGWGYSQPNAPGQLAVTFFPGLYANYTIAHYDKSISIVTDQDKSYLWILSRRPHLTENKTRILQWLKTHGFSLEKLHWH